MTNTLTLLADFCATVPAGPGAAVGLALAGLAGSPLHCAPMCGGFVLGQVADRMARIEVQGMCEWRRVSAGALVPYHLGRITTYAGLGAVAAWGGGWLAQLPWVGALLLGIAALLFLAVALRRLGRWLPAPSGALTIRISAWLRAPAARIDRTRPMGGYLLGVLLGFLPCGFLYAALAAAAATGSPLAGALGMAAFGAGTVPALIAIGVAGHAAGQRWKAAVTMAAPALLLLNAAMLAALALRALVA